MELHLLVLATALAVEGLAGYPPALYARIRHPVVWFGALINRLDRRLNHDDAPPLNRRLAGVLGLAILLAVVGWGAAALVGAVRALPFGGVLEALLAATLLAQRSLYDHVAAVAAGLRQGGLDGGRRAVAMIVGRDPATLDEHGVARAAIESLAENFSDGIVAPAVWLALGGLPGIALYKAVNTADSMIGHRTPRHESYGWAAARLDDLVNLPGSRLSALLIVGAAWLTPGTDAAAALASVRKDAGRHRSPNAGWPESAMAGALDLRLGGPRVYGATRVTDHWIGPGRTAATVEDIDRALAVFRRACLLLLGTAVVLGLLLG